MYVYIEIFVYVGYTCRGRKREEIDFPFSGLVLVVSHQNSQCGSGLIVTQCSVICLHS